MPSVFMDFFFHQRDIFQQATDLVSVILGEGVHGTITLMFYDLARVKVSALWFLIRASCLGRPVG